MDQTVKSLVRAQIPPGSSLPVLPPVLWLTRVDNRGVAFGLLGDAPVWVGAAVVLVVVFLLFYSGRRWPAGPLGGVGMGLLAGGAAGNLVDRLRLGVVIDYLDLRVWPVFNLADACVVGGAGLLLLTLARRGR